ncbi:MAG: hypothetical protein OSA81_04265 [Longimicrobiales bacterium]|nr:hypothetical protein [Longimicrobiales bacterium]
MILLNRGATGFPRKGGLRVNYLGGALRSAGFLYEVSSLDPSAMLTPPVLLGSIASLRTYMPTRRAALVNPFQALRAD